MLTGETCGQWPAGMNYKKLILKVELKQYIDLFTVV